MNLNLNTDETSALSDALLLVEEVSPNGIPMTSQCRRGLLLLKRLEGVRARLAAPEEAPVPTDAQLGAVTEAKRELVALLDAPAEPKTEPVATPVAESKP